MEIHIYLSHLGTTDISKRYQIKFEKWYSRDLLMVSYNSHVLVNFTWNAWEELSFVVLMRGGPCRETVHSYLWSDQNIPDKAPEYSI